MNPLMNVVTAQIIASTKSRYCLFVEGNMLNCTVISLSDWQSCHGNKESSKILARELTISSEAECEVRVHIFLSSFIIANHFLSLFKVLILDELFMRAQVTIIGGQFFVHRCDGLHVCRFRRQWFAQTLFVPRPNYSINSSVILASLGSRRKVKQKIR